MARSFEIKGENSERLKRMRTRFKFADESETKQCEREQLATAFEAGEQWTAQQKALRAGQADGPNGMPAVPDRPTLVINKLKEPVRQILNQERASDIGIQLVPADDFGDLGITPDDSEVKLREGLIRRIQRDPEAADARTWAFKRAVIAGRGYYMVMTRYLPGKTSSQEIYVHRIFNQAGVKLDPSHVKPDGSDADWAFVATWMPWDRFKATYPKDAKGHDNPFAESSEADFQAMCEEYPEWYQSEGDQKAVRIVDYFETEYSDRELSTLEDGTDLWSDEVPEGAKVVQTRTVIEKQIKFVKNAGGVLDLEETDWPGPNMPIVKVIGDEVLPYDGERRYQGVVEPAMDAQVGENYMISKLVETVGQSPIPLLQLDPDAIDGYESWYKVINTRTLPYAPYRSFDDNGRPLREPHRLPVDPNTQHLAQGVAMFDTFIKSTTAVPDSTLGNVDPSLKSGRAIREVVENAQMSTSNYMDNLARSMKYEAEIENGLLYPIYGNRPGRKVRTLNAEGEPETMVIGGPEGQDQALLDKAIKIGKLTEDATFNIVVKIAKNSDNRRKQFVDMFGSILEADPSQMAVGGDLFYKNSDLPEARELAKRQKLMLAPPIQAMLAQEEQGKEFDPVAQQQIAQLTERLQIAEQAMQELDEVANGKKLESQTKLELERIKSERDASLEQLRAQTDLEKARMDNATKIHVAEIAARTKGVVMDHESEHEAVALAHEAAQAELDRQHDRDAMASGMAHEAALGEGDQAFQAEQAEQARAAEAERAMLGDGA